MRPIDADKATEVVGYFLEQMGIALFGRNGKDLARTLLLRVPTIDAVSVVRCKECVKRMREDCPMCNCCKLDRMPTEDDDYCSYGERKE